MSSTHAPRPTSNDNSNDGNDGKDKTPGRSGATSPHPSPEALDLPRATGAGGTGTAEAQGSKGRQGRPRRRHDPTARSQTVAAWVLAVPFMAVFLVFTAGPVLASLGMSFTDIRSTDARHPLAVSFVGLENYTRLLGDELFRKVALNTLLYLLLGVPLTLVVAMAVAVGLNRVTRFKGFFRVGFYLPVVTSIVAVSVVWKFLLRENGGLVNSALEAVGLPGQAWLDDTHLALPSLVVMAVWRNFGTMTVIFLAALQTVPTEITEAAESDGAGAWARFRHVTLPMLRPTILFGAVITGIGYLQFFEEAFVMTSGGPLDSTRSISYYTYDQFGFGNYGLAAAASYLLFLAIVLLTLLQFRLLRSKD
ncbi:sugar ABC transporter permease [Nocardioides sp. GY 10127]|uniref:carbohydrate ABC transporter permease n=1 Tax=Nocardioides sp. GY 10127 TaxID=2569762 RepID=UPI0010A8577C|nr:sugar ABC transporter permease [Nocardioides sp. GY 10127]TIC84422.1 sugar ABC transporter permease [Nocardioides sp. GY 10127]